jgi:hypothetical protein
VRRYFRRRASRGARWSTNEDQIIKTFYPDYAQMQRCLQARSYYAIRNRARALGAATRRHVWTNSEVARLRTLYLRGATCAEIAAAFPGFSWHQVASKARHIRLVRGQREPYILGVPPIDVVRKQAVIRGWTWRKLDKFAKTGRYFQQTTRRVDWDHLAKAIEILGGTIEIAWLSHETA